MISEPALDRLSAMFQGPDVSGTRYEIVGPALDGTPMRPNCRATLPASFLTTIHTRLIVAAWFLRGAQGVVTKRPARLTMAVYPAEWIGHVSSRPLAPAREKKNHTAD